MLVSAGFAAALVPELALGMISQQRVRVVTLPGLGARRIGVLYRRSRNEPTPAVRTVLDALRFEANRWDGDPTVRATALA